MGRKSKVARRNLLRNVQCIECKFCGTEVEIKSGSVLGALSVDLATGQPHWKQCKDYYNNRVGRIHARNIRRANVQH